MRPLNQARSRILETLTRGLNDEQNHRRIDNAPGSFMAVVVEKIGPARYSVAHYYKQNGDLVADPDLEFVVQDGRIVTYKRKAYADLRSFAGTLLTNIKRQQGDLSSVAA